MSKMLQLPQSNLNGGAHSWHHLDRVPLEVQTMKEHRATSFPNNLQNVYASNSQNTSLELLYKITDIVLVICALIFIISSVASIMLWVCGLIWMELLQKIILSLDK